MAIVFFCQSCGSRFEVDSVLAGRRGRCKHCGHAVTIPSEQGLPQSAERHAAARAPHVGAGGAALAVATSAGAGDVAGQGQGQAKGASISSWLHSTSPDAKLAPLPPEPPARPVKPSPLDDAPDDRPYALAGAEMKPPGPARSHDQPALRAWRRTIGRLRRPFRFLNESAYLVSTPFLMALLLGGVLHSRPLVVVGAAAVVLLNLARIAAGAIDLVLVPLRDGLNLDKLRKPFRRVAEPALTIGLVVLLFAFVPWLSNGDARASGGPRRRVRDGARAVRRDVQAEIGKAVHAVESALDEGASGRRERARPERSD